MTKKCYLLLVLILALSHCDNPVRQRPDDTEYRERQIQELYENFDSRFKELLADTVKEMGKEVLRYEEIHPDLFPKKLIFSGNYLDVGKFVGLMALKHGIYPNMRTPENQKINEQIEQMYQEVFPPFLERARGIAWAYQLNLEDLDLRHLEYGFTGRLWWQLFRYNEFLKLTHFNTQTSNMCSVVSYYLEDEGRHLVGRNFDLPTDRPHFLVESHLSDVYTTVGMTCYQLQNKISDGINEKGLFMAIASNTSPAEYGRYAHESYPDVPAIWSVHLLRVVLDCCATVDEALDLVKKVRIWFPDELQHFLIADAQGNSVVIEFDQHYKLHVFPRSEPFLVLTNTAYLEGLDFVYNHCYRFRRATDLFEQGISDMEGLWRVVRSMQMRIGSTRSLWSSTADLKNLEYDARFRTENYEIPHVLTIE